MATPPTTQFKLFLDLFCDWAGGPECRDIPTPADRPRHHGPFRSATFRQRAGCNFPIFSLLPPGAQHMMPGWTDDHVRHATSVMLRYATAFPHNRMSTLTQEYRGPGRRGLGYLQELWVRVRDTVRAVSVATRLLTLRRKAPKDVFLAYREHEQMPSAVRDGFSAYSSELARELFGEDCFVDNQLDAAVNMYIGDIWNVVAAEYKGKWTRMRRERAGKLAKVESMQQECECTN